MSMAARDEKRELEIVPPEGVAVRFRIASLSARFGAQVLDMILTGLIVALVVFVISTTALLESDAASVLALLLTFLLRIPYYILTELIWNGRTPGKRGAGIRVINMHGQRLTPHQIVARNLMKEVEFFTPLSMISISQGLSGWGKVVTLILVFGVAIVPFTNRRRQRLGDMIAGTVVVDNPRAQLLPDIALSAASEASQQAFAFLPGHLNVYGRFELQTLEDLLRDPLKAGSQTEIRKITTTITRKIGFDGLVRPGEELVFLNAFYRAQREHLEKLRLFGTKREDKFQRDESQ